MMPDPLLPSPDEPTTEIADAGALFGDVGKPKASSSPSAASSSEAEGQYELDDAPEVQARPTLPPIEPPARDSHSRPSASRPSPRLEPSDGVEQVWSRSAEWGGTIAVLAAAGMVLLGLLYILLSFEWYSFAFLVFVAGGLTLAFLSYPILITLERPVRITPEQAARDFFTALSHHRPHYRRMWLLLSTNGRVSGSFASFEGFSAYWAKRLAELRAGKASGWTPLKFQVDDFKSEKSAGQTEIEGRYVVNVFIRGRQDEGPVASFPVRSRFVRGSDKMWYMERGTLG